MQAGIKLIILLILEVKMAKSSIQKPVLPVVPKAVPQLVIPAATNGNKGGKTLIPLNLQEFTIEQLRGTGETGRSIRELRIISENRAKPPVDRQQNPPKLPNVKRTSK